MFILIPFFLKPRLFFRDQIFWDWNQNLKQIGKSLKTEKFQNHTLNIAQSTTMFYTYRKLDTTEWWGACMLEKLLNLQFQITLGEKHIAFSFSEYLSAC